MYAGDSQKVQVFTFDRFDLVDPWNIRLDPSLIGRTLLINVSPFDVNGNKGPVQITNIGGFYDPWGERDREFSPEILQAMLWNFYGATKVTLDPGAGIRFPGSILIPHGDLDMLWHGQSGWTIVRGNVFHNSPGSIFHNFEFDPPHPLPLPPNLTVVQECDPFIPPEGETPGPPLDSSTVVSPWSTFRPPVCIAELQQCYRTMTGETENRFNTCCKDPDGSETMTCEGGPWNAFCIRRTVGETLTKLPKFDPKGNDWGLIDVAQAGSPNDSCPDAMNLGPLLSKSTGFNNTFPLLSFVDLKAKGRESEIALLVGGNYFSALAADIEGNIVVLGDFIVGASGVNSLGT